MPECPHRSLLRLALVAGIGLGFAGCSGGGGGSDGDGDEAGGPLPLQTKADVQNAAGNFVRLAYDRFNVDPYSAPAAAATTTKRRKPASTDPKAMFDCRVSGNYTEEQVSATRTFTFFPQTLAVSGEREIDSACRENAPRLGTGYTITYDGFYESGTSAPDANGTSYSYRQRGRNGVAGSTTIEGPGYLSRTTELGLEESYENSLGGDSRYLTTETFDLPGAQDGSLTLGSGTTPFAFFSFRAGPVYYLNGPLSFTASGCAGGELTLTTNDPITFGEDTVDAYVTGGSLSIASGSRTVDLSFQADGSVVYQVRGGIGGTLTRAEVLAGGCSFIAPEDD